MGYQITITRTSIDDDFGEIEKDEWLAYVKTDPELTLEDENNPFPVVFWKRGVDEGQLIWEDVGIWTGGFGDEPLIRKMVEIARACDARAIGEDDIVFDLDGDGKLLEISPAIEKPKEPQDEPEKSWWKRLFS